MADPGATTTQDDDGSDFFSLLGSKLAGAPPDEAHDAGIRTLLGFGAGMLSRSGYSPVPQSLSQAIGAGIQGAGDVAANQQQLDLARAKLGLTAQQQQQAYALGLGNLDVSRGTLAMLAQERQLQFQEFNLKLQQWQQRQDAIRQLLGGAPGVGAGGTVAPAASGDTKTGFTTGMAMMPNMPAPNDVGSLDGWQDKGDLAPKIVAEATKQGLDPNIALGVAMQESRGNPNVAASGPNGAYQGVFQIGEDATKDQGGDPATRGELGNNISLGIGYLKRMVDRYGPVGGVAAYNAGPKTWEDVTQGKRALPDSTKQYVSNVAAIALKAPSAPGGPAPASVPQASGPSGPAAPGGPGAPYPVAGAVVPPPTGGGPSNVQVSPVAPGGMTPQPSSGLPAGVKPGLPAVAPGQGTQMPPPQDIGSLASFPQLQAQFRQALLGEMAKPDGDVGKVITDFTTRLSDLSKTPRFRILQPGEAQQVFGQQYDPRSTYSVDQFGNFKRDTPPEDPARLEILKSGMAYVDKNFNAPADDAAKRLRVLDTMQALQPQIEQDYVTGRGGALQEYLRPVEGVASSLGLLSDKFKTAVGAQAAYQSLASNLAGTMRPQGMNRITQFEFQNFMNQVPSLSTTPEGRNIITQMFRNFSQRELQEAQVANETVQRDGSTLNLRKNLDQFNEANPIVRNSPDVNAPGSQWQDFRNSIRPGEVYKNYDGQYKIFTGRPQPGALPTYQPPTGGGQ